MQVWPTSADGTQPCGPNRLRHDGVVILGAGMDSRAYRLARRSDVPVFEVDLPVNIVRKKAAVQRAIGVPSSVHLVALDFERDGVNMYDPAVLYRRFRQRQQVWKVGMNPDDAAGFIGEFGWRLVEQAEPDHNMRNYIEPTGPRAACIAARVVGVRTKD